MNYAQLKWPAPFMIATIAAGIAVATIPHVRLVDLFLDSGTGILAGLGAAIAGTRLIVGQLGSRGPLAWKLTLAVLLFAALGEFCEPFAEAAGQQLRIDNIDDLLLLAAGAVGLWLLASLKPAQVVPQRLMLAGLALQVLATALDTLDGGPVGAAFPESTGLATYADFTQLLSTWSYVSALSWAAIHACRSVGDIFGAAPNVAPIGSWPFIAIVRACSILSVHGARVQGLTGKTKPEQFIEQLNLALRHRIPPIYYYVYEFYRPGQRRRAKDYLMRHAAKEIAHSLLDLRPTECYTPTPLANKVGFAQHCRLHGLRHIPVLMMFESGACLKEPGFVSRLPDADIFVKPVLGNDDVGAERWRSLGGSRFKNMRGDRLEAGALLAHVAHLSLAQPSLIQYAVSNHREISRLSAGALSTVRLLSCRNERGDFEVTNAAFRMSVDPKSPVDGFAAGGIAAAVDIGTGTLGFATDLGHAPDTEWHTVHPFSGAQIAEWQLPMWQETIDLAVRAHRAFNDYAVVSWDIAILEDGPCLIAGNCEPDVDIMQRTADAPIGSGRFGALLAYNLERKGRVR